MRSESLSFLTRLLETPTPSGFEAPGQRLWLDYVKPFADRVWSDAHGNCFAAIEPTGASRTMAICGHCDEIGLMVNHVDAQGFVYCRAIGGIDAGSIVGKRIRFQSSVPGVTEPVMGLIGATAIHLQDKSSEGKVRKLHELFIDIGAKDQASALARLNIGDPGVFADGPMSMGDGLLVARALDNRIGIFAAAEALRLVHAERSRLKVRVVAVSTVQEEVGLHGAAMIAQSLAPDLAFVTDVGHATDSPGISHAQHGQFKLGGGPKLAVGLPVHAACTRMLAESAVAQGITVQRSATAGRSGTDTDAIFTRNGGIPCGLLSLPIRYMHTTVELCALKDLEQIGQVFAGAALAMTGAESLQAIGPA